MKHMLHLGRRKFALLTGVLLCLLISPMVSNAQKITNLRIPGVEGVLCLSDHENPFLEFDLEGDWPENTTFTAYITNYFPAQPLEIGEVQGTENLSIPLSFLDYFAFREASIFIEAIIEDETITSDGLEIEVYPEIRTTTTMDFSYPISGPGEGISVVIPAYSTQEHTSQFDLEYMIVHLESESSVTDWMMMPDDGIQLNLIIEEEGTYQLFARAKSSDGTVLCQDSTMLDGQFTITFEEEELAITNLRIPGVEDVLCLVDIENPVLEFDTEGEFPENTIFTAYITHLSEPLELGQIEGTEELSIPLSFPNNFVFRHYSIFIEATINGNTIQSDEGLQIEVFPEINTSTGLVGPDHYTADQNFIEAMIPEYTAAQNASQFHMEYMIVHMETETSATNWVRIDDTPLLVQIDDPMEGTYQLFGRAQSSDGSVTCQDSVMLEGQFTISFDEKELAITNLRIPGTDQVICLVEHEELTLEFDLEGDFPEDAVFNIVLSSPHIDADLNLGTIHGTDDLSLPLDFPDYSVLNDATIWVSTTINGETITSHIIHDIIPAVDPNVEVFIHSEVIAPGESVTGTLTTSAQRNMQYIVIHQDSETEVTDWMTMGDTPMDFVIEDAEEGTYQIYARAQASDGTICQDMIATEAIFTITFEDDESLAIVNLNIPGVENVLCLVDVPNPVLEFDLEGDWPENTTFTAYITNYYPAPPLEIGEIQGTENLSIPLSFPEYFSFKNASIYIEASVDGTTIESESLNLEVFPEIRTTTTMLIDHEPTEQGQDVYVTIPAFSSQETTSQYGIEYLIVHIELEASVTEWMEMSDDGLQFNLTIDEEGTYQLFARARSSDGTVLCQDSVMLDGHFTITFEDEEVAPRPIIHSFDPTSGWYGDEVTIIGEDFIDIIWVRFNGEYAEYEVIDENTIIAKVPEGATTGIISVAHYHRIAYSEEIFIITPPAPAITSFDPGSGVPGTEVTITGNYFMEVSAVQFNGEDAADFTVVNLTTITAIVPDDAQTGKITVVAEAGTAVSVDDFVIEITSLTAKSANEAALKQNYPNPFSTSTVIPVSLQKAGHISIEVFNVTGELVDVPASGTYAAGQHNIDCGQRLPAGTYFYRLTTEDSVETKKMVKY
ncbi:MAG: IPT/TIG domain-containing protein [Cytophagaceae bacterium]